MDLSRRAVLAASLAATPLAALASKGPRKLVRPPALKPGDSVALIAPASTMPDAAEVESARQFVFSLGFRPVFGLHATKTWGYLAGTDEERAADLNWALRDPSVDGIMCLRGGYGAMRFLPSIDYEAARAHPKVFIGYSDITALLVAITQKAGVVTFHGPVGTSSVSEFSTNWMMRALTQPRPLGTYTQPDPAKAGKGDFELVTVHGGKASGPLVGGNLTLLSCLMGTPYAPDIAGKILFIEEVQEAPYRIDRMLTQMWLSGDLQKVRGVALGQFTDCDSQEPGSSWRVRDIVALRLKPLGVPVLSGLPIGHVKDKITLPLGAMAQLDADAQTLTVLEPAVS
ncbi:MAG: LD-carboxypeptidase [Fimbriimonadaceae bacterium]|nr:LD-carboxypeptidase [Fimbriimonadaceae bacterium]